MGRLKSAHSFFPLLVGLLLGLIQTGFLFQLMFTLSSGFSTYLMMTLCWLIGSVIGALWFSKTAAPLPGFLALMLSAYGLCGILLHIAPFQTHYWPLYAGLIIVAGIYPGVFFARMNSRYLAHQLFFFENNGFIAGLAVGTILFMLFGRIILWVAPVLVAGLAFLGEPQGKISDQSADGVQGGSR
jgi:hypothetical protein